MKQEADTERTEENAPDVTVAESWLEGSRSQNQGRAKSKTEVPDGGSYSPVILWVGMAEPHPWGTRPRTRV